jgi:hypothetical protein
MGQVVSFRFRPSFPAKASPNTNRIDEVKFRAALGVKSVDNAGIEPGFIGRPFHIPVTVPTEVSFVIINYVISTPLQVLLGWAELVASIEEKCKTV